MGESRLIIGDVAVVLRLPRVKRKISDFASFWCCWLATSSSQKHPEKRFWQPKTTVWRTRHPHIPDQDRASISPAVVLCEEP